MKCFPLTSNQIMPLLLKYINKTRNVIEIVYLLISSRISLALSGAFSPLITAVANLLQLFLSSSYFDSNSANFANLAAMSSSVLSFLAGLHPVIASVSDEAVSLRLDSSPPLS